MTFKPSHFPFLSLHSAFRCIIVCRCGVVHELNSTVFSFSIETYLLLHFWCFFFWDLKSDNNTMKAELVKGRDEDANLNGCVGSRNQIVDVAFEVVELIIELWWSFTNTIKRKRNKSCCWWKERKREGGNEGSVWWALQK